MRIVLWVSALLAAAPLGAQDAAVVLPPGIAWNTNYDDPPIGSPEAIRGGTFNDWIGAYPLTFRLVGPNSNDGFAGWNRLFTMAFSLVKRHPVTDNYIPWMATAWSVQDDQRTVYVRLDPDARWSDGEPITADDWVFTYEMFQSPHIVDPFYAILAQETWESIDKIDDYTLRIVGKDPSWRPLWDFLGIWPTPSHVVTLDSTWVERTNNEPQVAPGPYIVTGRERGESVTFSRVDGWWGEGKHYFRGLYNPDTIQLRVVPEERSLDYLRLGQIDVLQENTARTWNEDYTFEAVRNGWIKRARVFVDFPQGVYGLAMNLEAPIFQDKDFRKAIQYLFNFERLNRNLMFDEYLRISSFFEGTEYANPDIEPYSFDPQRAREHLARAGYRRPSENRSRGLLASAGRMLSGLITTRAADDDILVNDRGEKASFSIVYGSKGLERHLTVMQQDYRRAGVEVRLRLLEPGAAFERGLERKYEMHLMGRGTSFFPDPRQYLHTEFRDTTNNNNVWGFGTPQVDSLIEVFEDDLDLEDRQAAMWRIDEIVHDEAFHIPFWGAPFVRLAYWDYIGWPDNWLPKRVLAYNDWPVFWIDPDRKAALEEAMRTGTPLPVDQEIDKDPYDLVDDRQ